MKKLLVICLGLLMAGAAMAQISGTKHDFSSSGWNTTGQICIACHTPHNAETVTGYNPLWNHEVTTATFTLYSNAPTFQATDPGQPTGVSLLCLSCHDGTVALDSFGGVTGTTTMGSAAAANLGTDLSDDHPVSFTYNSALATTDGELFDPSTANSSLGGTIAVDMLTNDKMECSSCHDVHGGIAGTKLLVIDNAGSALCLTCHNK